jgi:Zn-dependent oligopeptidase
MDMYIAQQLQPHTVFDAYSIVQTIPTFQHVTSYAGVYYSYQLSKIVSSNIWHELFASDPLNRQAGERLRRELLQKGCSIAPQSIFQSLLQRVDALDTTHYLTSLGVA